MLFIGIDSGTQSTKAILYDVGKAKVLASAQQKYGMIEGLPEGHLEQHPRTWIDAVDVTVAEVLEAAGNRRKEVRGIGVSAQQHGLVVLDKNCKPIRPAKLWCDTSTVEQCEAFDKAFGGAKGLVELAGNPMLPGYTAPKILWLKENEPGNWKSVRTILLPHDYINLHLTGETRMEHGDASGTGLLDVRKRKWCTKLLEFIDPDLAGLFPTLGASSQPAGLLRSLLAEKWGLSGQVLVSAGGGDNMMGAIGTGNVQPGVMTASLGTSGTLYAYSKEPVIDDQAEIAAFCDSTGHWLPLVCTMNVTVVTEAVRNCFGWDLDQLEREVDAAPPGAGGVLFLPYLQGERTPSLPEASGVIHGLNPANLQPGNLARAAVEGASMGLGYGLHRFRSLGVEPREIRVTGGGSHSGVWRQLLADVFGIPVVGLQTVEGAALGAALQACWTWNSVEGQNVSLKDLTDSHIRLDEKTRCAPDGERSQFYAELIKKQSGFTSKLHAMGYL